MRAHILVGLMAFMRLSPAVALAQADIRVEQMTRQVALDANAQVHSVTVFGWPGMTTGIRFPDTFQASQVLCGQCAELSEDVKSFADPNRPAQHNWIIDKRPQDRSIYIRPATLPDEDLPPSAFATNIHIALDGGHVVVVDLRLFVPPQSERFVQVRPDAMVTLLLPAGATVSGRIAEELSRLDKRVLAKGTQFTLQLMMSTTHCQDIRWRKPYRRDKTVVRLNRLCRNERGTAYWVTFTVENRHAMALNLDRAELAPHLGGETAEHEGRMFAFSQKSVAPDRTAEGIALWQTESEEEEEDKAIATSPEFWTLSVFPNAAQDMPVVIDHLTF